MKAVSVLSALDAIRAISADHPEIDTWWYEPLAGQRVEAVEPSGRLEIVVATAPGATADCNELSVALARRLGVPVDIRNHRGGAEPQPLLLLLRPRREREVKS